MIPGAITARPLHKVPVAHRIPSSTRRMARRVIPSGTSNRVPLHWDQVKDDPEWAEIERKWQGYAESNSLDKIAKDFQEMVGPILAEIQLSDYVSDLRSKAPSTPGSGAGPNPPTTLQWVDLVLAGGALLGVAHVGYILALESVGIRFRALAGTSAGAMAAVLLAGLRESPEAAAGEALLLKLLDLPVPSFKDGLPADKALGDALIGLLTRSGISWSTWTRLPLFPWALARIWKNGGVHPGKTLYDWVHGVLAANRAGTLGQLRSKCDLSAVKFEKVPDVESVEDRPLEGLVVAVAADVTTSTKAALSWERPFNPATRPLTVSELYWTDPDSESPAACVRASVSIPIFFQPYIVPADPALALPGAGVPANTLPNSKWSEVGFDATIPDRVQFQDGGLLSCFPLNLFHVASGQQVRCPTFGVGLSDPRRAASIGNLGELLAAATATATNIQDYEFVSQNKEYKLLAQLVNVAGVPGLDFNLPIIGKYVLFHNGVLAARDFLMGGPGRAGFDWKYYKQLRVALSNANRT
ncbi:hypothetical protein ACKKBF_B09060 [Auxenochlorella protothecoides x Auxenochlorella symbiontica]